MTNSELPLPAFSAALRYRVPTAARLLDQSVSRTWADIAAGKLAVIREGGRTWVPGSEIARRCAIASQQDAAA